MTARSCADSSPRNAETSTPAAGEACTNTAATGAACGRERCRQSAAIGTRAATSAVYGSRQVLLMLTDEEQEDGQAEHHQQLRELLPLAQQAQLPCNPV